MKYQFFQDGDQKSYLEGRIRAEEYEHFQLYTQFKIMEASQDVEQMVAIKSQMTKLEAVISTLNAELLNFSAPRA